MTKKIAIHQPEFLPWLGFFHKLLRSDVFIILDIVQYNKQDFQNRNIVVENNQSHWITIPLVKHSSQTLIKDILICNNINWQEQIKRKLHHYYFTEEFFEEVYKLLVPIWKYKWERLTDLNVFIIKEIMNYLQIDTELYLASDIISDIVEFHQMKTSDKNMLMCQLMKANLYLSGRYGKNYLDEERFFRNNIKIEYVQYPSDKENYSIVHSLFKYGRKTRELL